MKKVNLLEAGLKVGDTVYRIGAEPIIVVDINDSNFPIHCSDGVRYNKFGCPSFVIETGVSIFLSPPDFEIPTTKPELDWAKIFTVDKPFMVKDKESEEWKMAFALTYLGCAEYPFYCLDDGKKRENAEWFKLCRKLTPEELKRHGFDADVYE